MARSIHKIVRVQQGLLLVLVLAAPLNAQREATATIWSGVVRSATGQPVAGASVMVSTIPGKQQTAVTGTRGQFAIKGLASGPHTVTVQLPGRRPTAPVVLEIGNASVALTVSDQDVLSVDVNSQAASGASNAGNGTSGETLSSEKVNELPLNGRDFSTLLLLAAGTMTDVNGQTNFTQQFAINGQRGVEAVFAMDGADVSDPEMGGSTFTNFNVDAIQDLQSSSGWMPADIGRGAAGFTNIVTRSGKNGFHGSFFEFLRNSSLDARNYFDHPLIAEPGRIPPFRRNEFGFTNGGPVVLPNLYDGRDRTFYFVQYQGFRQVLGTTQVLAVPTAAERDGEDVVTYPDGSTDNRGDMQRSLKLFWLGGFAVGALLYCFWYLHNSGEVPISPSALLFLQDITFGLWPSSIMLMSLSGQHPLTAWAIVSISLALNGLIYVGAGYVLGKVFWSGSAGGRSAPGT